MLKRPVFEIPSLLHTDIIMTQMPYFTLILDLAIFRSQKYFFANFILLIIYLAKGGHLETLLLLIFFGFEAPFSRFGHKNRLVRIFQLIFFTGHLLSYEEA